MHLSVSPFPVASRVAAVKPFLNAPGQFMSDFDFFLFNYNNEKKIFCNRYKTFKDLNPSPAILKMKFVLQVDFYFHPERKIFTAFNMYFF